MIPAVCILIGWAFITGWCFGRGARIRSLEREFNDYRDRTEAVLREVGNREAVYEEWHA